MKKFIKKHPVLYWIIVCVVAVAVFVLVTLKGCAKLQKAYASETADGVYFPSLNELSLGDYEDEVRTLINSKYYAVISGGDGTYTFVFDNSNPFKLYNGNCLRVGFSADTDGQRNTATWFKVNSDASLFEFKRNSSSNLGWTQTGCLVGTNFTLIKYGSTTNAQLQNAPQNNLVLNFEVVPTVHYTYFINAPYLEAVNVDVYNALLENQREDNIEESEWQLYLDLKGQPMDGVTEMIAHNEYYVWLPSLDFISTKIGQYEPFDMGNDAALYNYNLSGLEYDIASWQGKVGSNRNSVLYKIKREEIYDPAYDIKERYDYKDLLDIIETQYGYRDSDGEWVDFSLAGYYGFDDDDKGWLNIWRPIVFSYLYISRVDSQLYTYVSVSEIETDVYYGRYMIYDFVLSDTVVNTAISEDMQSTDIPSDIDDIIDSSREESYKDVIKDMHATEEELKQQIGNMTGSLGSFDTEFEGVDLWNGIKGFGSGLVGLTGFLGNIATALGSVFVFMPYDVRQLVGYFFMASLVVALWKLIKR